MRFLYMTLFIVAVKDDRIREALDKELDHSSYSYTLANPDRRGILSAIYDANQDGFQEIIFITDSDLDSVLPNYAEEAAENLGLKITKVDCRHGAPQIYFNREL